MELLQKGRGRLRTLQPQHRPGVGWTTDQLLLDAFSELPDCTQELQLQDSSADLGRHPPRSLANCDLRALGTSWKSWPDLLCAFPPQPCREEGQAPKCVPLSARLSPKCKAPLNPLLTHLHSPPPSSAPDVICSRF